MKTRLAGYDQGYSAIKALYVNPREKWYTDGQKYLINNEYGYIAIVFACNEQDALDTLVDESTKLDSCLVEYGEDVFEEHCTLGNAGELFDLSYIGIKEV